MLKGTLETNIALIPISLWLQGIVQGHMATSTILLTPNPSIGLLAKTPVLDLVLRSRLNEEADPGTQTQVREARTPPQPRPSRCEGAFVLGSKCRSCSSHLSPSDTDKDNVPI